MATCATKPAVSLEDLLPPLPPEGPELDALIKALVAEADADPRPGIPHAQVFAGLRRRHAERVLHDQRIGSRPQLKTSPSGLTSQQEVTYR